MESRAKILGHPAHQILVMFPIGLLGFAVVCDVARAFTRGRYWTDTARTAIGAGLVGTAIAAPFGLADYLAIPAGTRAKAVGRAHGLGNLGVIGLFAASYAMRRGRRRPAVAASVLSTAGLLLASGTAWLGTELINRLGVGVYGLDRMNAPSSLRESRAVRAVARTGLLNGLVES
jgi:uncharacterized membrane protein